MMEKEPLVDIEGKDRSPYVSIHDHMHWEDGKLVDDPIPDNVYMSPQNTERLLREEVAQKYIKRILHQIVEESIYKQDMVWQVWHTAHELEEANGLPDGMTAETLFQHYLRVYEAE